MQEKQSLSEALGQVLKSRASCRAFSAQQVDPDVVRNVLGDAQHVPSWCNAQPWQVHVAMQSAELAQALYDHSGRAGAQSDLAFPTRYEGIYRERRKTCGVQLYEAVGVAQGDRLGSARQMRENFRLFGAPHFMLITCPKALGPYAVLDCGAYVTAVLLGLEARGLGAVPMASVAAYSDFMRDWFAVEDERDVLCGIAFGHPDRTAPVNQFRTTRAPMDQVVRFQ
jgi:nitroreductase